jgi:hypothetical protein
MSWKPKVCLAPVKRIARGLFCVCIAFLTLEMCSRLEDWVFQRASPLQSYDFSRLMGEDPAGVLAMPNERYFKWRTNSLGFRGPELREGTIRVACAGLSETFGIYEREDGEYPRLLEQKLNERSSGPEFEVVNLGLPGSSFRYLCRHIPGIVERIRPDIFVVYPSFANYIWLPSGSSVQEHLLLPVMPFPGSPESLRSPWWTPRFSQRWDRIVEATVPPTFRTWLTQRSNERRARRLGGSFRQLPEEKVVRFREDLEALLDFLEQKRIPVVLATHATSFGEVRETEDHDRLVAWRSSYPALEEGGLLDMEERMNRVVRENAAKRHVHFVDAARLMPTGHKYFGDFVHFSDEGANAFAALLTPEVLSAAPAATSVPVRYNPKTP